MKYAVHHESRIAYRGGVSNARLNVRLEPAGWPGQAISDFALSTDPAPLEQRSFRGPYHVNVTSMAFGEDLSQLELVSSFVVEVDPSPVPASDLSPSAVREEALALREVGPLSPTPYLFASRIAGIDEEITRWAGQYVSQDAPLLAGVTALNSAIHQDFTYKSGISTSRTSPEEIFRDRRGVCQDFAHLMIAGLRGQGVPCAYVSGYLRTMPPPGIERLIGADAMHAWVAVWCGAEFGWVGFDPTNDCLAHESHIVVAMGRDFADVSPIDGVFLGSPRQVMEVSVDVAPLD